ncbi:lipid acyl hydrolase [Grosmannia clavigera kw1407]|uniref:Lysophospholipase NTE1 n=1 Tax=Grosmannia clavigera (strain kw1407 / UAMH 11150) TaxID=655863 RepID=F0XHX8_GROCL|nr:lipid acyl hydrolase [Grosmannia clavigera kw1407]EFX02937.1 lipid acyl hydrolase [Grosmannia clavigera kw1407]
MSSIDGMANVVLAPVADASVSVLSSAVATAGEVAANHGSTSWIGLFARLILAILHLVSTILYFTIKLTTFSIPTILFTLFSTTLTVTMNATTLMLIVFAIFSGVSWFVRYRYLNVYARLPPEPQRKEPDVDLFPDTHDEGIKSGLSSYLDEFLSAIKIFGYLERPVFHELTRSMMTRKLIAGETLNLEEEKGFCIVVDGLVEIFVKSSRPGNSRQHSGQSRRGVSLETASSDDESSSPAQQRYQLLTEVRNGAPMSSLFSLMSLFTEDIDLRQSEDDTTHDVSDARNNSMRYPASAGLGLSQDPRTAFSQMPLVDEPSENVRPSEPTAGSNLPPVPHMNLDSPPHIRRPGLKRTATSSVHPDIIARATVDTTIAIIPASAFRRLIRVYPKATAHIVHVILSRFQRVTLATAYSYLGLSGEVMQTEKNMIKYSMCQLPNFLRGDALDRLKEKFERERERIGEDEVGKGIALHNPASSRPKRSSTTMRKEAALHSLARQRPESMSKAAGAFAKDRRPTSDNAGDFANMQTTPGNGKSVKPSSKAAAQFGFSPMFSNNMTTPPRAQRPVHPFVTPKHTRMSMDGREELDEDNIFRESVLECMFKAIGLNSTSATPREVESTEASPRLVSYDSMRQKAVFSNNAFGFMDPFNGSADGDAESMTSGGMAGSPPSVQSVARDMVGEVEIVFFPKGSVLVEQGERNPGLYYVIDGFLDICIPERDASSLSIFDASHSKGPSATATPLMDDPFNNTFATPKTPQNDEPKGSSAGDDGKKGGRARRSVALIKPGGLAGYIGTVSSYRSFIDVVAKTDVYVGFLPRTSLERIVDRYPIVLLTMAKRLTHILPRLILHIDFALEWLQVSAGQVIFHRNEESEAIYIVLNGRLRLVDERKDGGMAVLAEYGQGDSVGELEVLTETARSGTLHAIRDTELVKFPRTLFNSLAQEHPNITIKISKIIASRMRNLMDNPAATLSRDGSVITTTVGKSASSTENLRTVAILPVTAGVPVVEFGNKLMSALSQVGTPNGATSLNQAAIMSHLGRHAFNRMGKLKLSQFLADLEEKYSLVVYVADTNVNSPWTQTCITQADAILLVGLAEDSPVIGEYERFMLGMKSTARKVLVLLHPERYSSSGLTRAWLKNRVWINGGHFHVQMAFRSESVPIHQAPKRFGPSLKERVQILQAEIQKYTSRKVRHGPFYSPDAPHKGDFQRLARRLCGKSIGLVLGGGGARGLAQVGIIRAMEEAGIPIDLIGGTSIGAFIGGLYARHADVVPIFGLSKKFAGRMASIWRFALDLTYPSASYTTGHEFNRGIFKTFGKTQIEDFWLEFYCNTTNISKSRMEVHTSGYAWRYVRASMSLAGLVPPLCDEGSMLLDGGYVDNLTVSHMKSLGADVIFAVDVGALDDSTPQAFGDTLSGFWAFVNRWNPLSSTPNPPTLAEIQARLAYVSSVDALERAKMMPGCFYMRPPIDDYGTLEFAKFDEIVQVGYRFGQEFLQKLGNEGRLPLMVETEAKKALRRTTAPRRASI